MILFFSLALLASGAKAQEGSPPLREAASPPAKLWRSLERKSGQAEERLARQTRRYLDRVARREERLRKRLLREDSLRARELFPGDAAARYRRLAETPAGSDPYARVYTGHLDSLTTALRFLEEGGVSGTAQAQALSSLEALQERLDRTDHIRQALEQRERELLERLQGTGLSGRLKPLRKQVYYFGAQADELQKSVSEPGRLEAALLRQLAKDPRFQSFFQARSQLGGIFNLQGTGPEAAKPGIQTLTSVGEALRDRFGEAGGDLLEPFRETQERLGSLLGQGGGIGPSEAEAHGFRPNGQRARPLLQRLEYGFNVQSQGARHALPASSELGGWLGYRLHDRASAGLGASYRLGWGSGIRDLRLSHQGLGLRTYGEYRLGGRYLAYAGYELNHRPGPRRAVLPPAAGDTAGGRWQPSGLAGLAVKYRLRGSARGSMQLLWDFLSYRQAPRTQAVLLRVGYQLR
ncbi:hypothetical protein C1N53_20475 [Pontibacter sp. SGAir0037]|nr:hypothetical protein C1N53_20475 [Pontibacter sp. SGAir0037]